MIIDKIKLGNSLQFKNLSNTIYHRKEAINKLLDEIVVLQKEKNEATIEQSNFRKDKEYLYEVEELFKNTKSFQELEDILKENNIEYKLSYREHLTSDGQLHWSRYRCTVNDISFSININEWEERIKEGDYYVEPIIEDEYAEPIFKCYGVE